MKISSSNKSLKSKFIPFKKVQKKAISSPIENYIQTPKKFKVKQKGKILNDLSISNYNSKTNTTDISIHYIENNSSSKSVVIEKKRKMSGNYIVRLPYIEMKPLFNTNNFKCKTPIRLRTLAKESAMMKESITKNILFTNQSSSQSSSRDNLIIGALKKKIKSLSRDLERKNEVIKEMRNQNEKTYHFNELYTENQKLKKEIVHLKELIIMNKGTDNNITNTCIDKNDFLIEQLKEKFNKLQIDLKESNIEKEELSNQEEEMKSRIKELEEQIKVKNKENSQIKKNNSMLSNILNKLVQKENKIHFETLLSQSEIEGIEYLLSKTFIANHIDYNTIFFVLSNNILHFERLVNAFLSLLNIPQDNYSLFNNQKILLMKYFITLSNSKGKFSFNKINEYFEHLFISVESTQVNTEIVKKNSRIIHNLIKGCEFYDTTHSGTISLEKFITIYEQLVKRSVNEKDELFDNLIIIMKEMQYNKVIGINELNYDFLQIYNILSPNEIKQESNHFINELFSNIIDTKNQ